MHYRHEEGRHLLLRNASAGASVDSKFDSSIVWPFLIQVSSNDRAEGYLGVIWRGCNCVFFFCFAECDGKSIVYDDGCRQFDSFGATLDNDCSFWDCVHVVR